MNSTSRNESRGSALERFIADLASFFFLKDFVFLSPCYVSGGNKRQITDLMFVLNHECVLVSIKGSDGNEKAPQRLELWAAKKAFQSGKNAKTACQRAAKVEITATNLWSETRVFPPGVLKPMCGVGIVECSQELFAPIQFSSEYPFSTSQFPIHFLSANDLLNVAMWLGSIRDVFYYLNARRQVTGAMNGINLERPLLCYYTLRSHTDFSGFLNEDKDRLGELHQLFLLDKLPQYAERDKRAAYVNAVIHQLHDRHKDFESYVPAELRDFIEPKEQRQAYLGMAALLNSLPMSNKAWIGRRIEESIQQVKRSGQSTCFLYRQLKGEVVFVFAVFTKLNRTEKMRALFHFVPAAQYNSGMGEALGIAYDADDENMGFELFWRRGPVVATDPIKRIAAELFSSPLDTLHPDPFGDATPYAPTEERSEK